MNVPQTTRVLEGYVRMSERMTDEEYGKIMRENLPRMIQHLKNPKKVRPVFTKIVCGHTPKAHKTQLCKKCYIKESSKYYKSRSRSKHL